MHCISLYMTWKWQHETYPMPLSCPGHFLWNYGSPFRQEKRGDLLDFVHPWNSVAAATLFEGLGFLPWVLIWVCNMGTSFPASLRKRGSKLLIGQQIILSAFSNYLLITSSSPSLSRSLFRKRAKKSAFLIYWFSFI